MAIVHLREQRDMVRDELAAKVEEEPTFLVGRIERGEVNADWATLRAIANVLGLPLDALMELAEEHAPGRGDDEWRQATRKNEKEREGASMGRGRKKGVSLTETTASARLP